MADEQKSPSGYGMPPKHAQFKKGVSGNAKGRPKGSKNLKTALETELNKKIPIKENGIEKQASKQQAVVMGLLQRALSGNQKATETHINTTIKLLPQVEEVKSSQ